MLLVYKLEVIMKSANFNYFLRAFTIAASAMGAIISYPFLVGCYPVMCEILIQTIFSVSHGRKIVKIHRIAFITICLY